MAYPDALNFSDYAVLQLGPVQTRAQKIAMCMINHGTVMTDVVVKTKRTLKTEFLRQVALASSGGWGKLNTDPQHTKNLPEPGSEMKYRYFKHWDIEKVILDQTGARGEQETFSRLMEPDLMELTFDLNNRFFNNRHTGANDVNRNADCFVGIRERLATAGASTNKWRIPSECRVNAGGLDLSSPSVTGFKDNVNYLFKLIEDGCEIAGYPEGNNGIIYRGQNITSLMNMGLRSLGAGGGWDLTKDAFDRTVTKYKNAVCRNAGRLAPDKDSNQAQVLGPEDATGALSAGGLYGSIFLVFSNEGEFEIEQFYETEPTDPETLDDMVTRRSVLYNFYGLTQERNRALVQIYNIKLA